MRKFLSLKSNVRLFLLVSLILVLVTFTSSFFAEGAQERALEEVFYFPNTHSHNDYYRTRPLLDALDNGMGSIEADVYYIEFDITDDQGNLRVMKELYVAHDWDEITGDSDYKTKGTLKELYLDPLYEIYWTNGRMIYNTPQETVLLHVDFKTDTDKTWNLLQSMLKNYPGLFTTYDGDSTKVIQGPVAVFTNAEPENIPDEWTTFYSTADGRFGNIYDPNVWKSDEYLNFKHRMPIISSNLGAYNDLTQFFDFLVDKEDIVSDYARDYPNLSMGTLYDELRRDGWALVTQLITDGKIKVSDYLIDQMAEADRLGREYGHLMRFWGSPDEEWFWDIQSPLTNVIINTDRPKTLREYLVQLQQQ